MRPLTTALLLTAALARPAPARAQDPLQTPATPAGASSPAVSLARLTGPISLDGRSDDPAWASVPTMTPVMLLPTFEGQPTQRTEFRFAYDATYFYASARMYVERRDDIRGNSLQRDRLGSDDIFRLILDTFNDNENGVGFATTPTGVRVDFSLAGDGQSINYDWNTLWDVATARTDSAWFAEMRIPLSSLRFQTTGGTVTMGVLALRSSSATNETVTYPAVSPRFAGPSTRVGDTASCTTVANSRRRCHPQRPSHRTSN